MCEFIKPTSQAFSMMSCGHVPSLSYSQATGRISLTAKSCAISRRFFCSSVSVKSTILGITPYRWRTALGPCRGAWRAWTVIDWSVNPRSRVAKRTPIGNNQDVAHSTALALQSAFPIVVFGAVVLSIVMSLIFLFSRGSVFDHIGDGGLTGERDAGPELPPAPPESAAGRAEQELEIRQMLSARSARMVGRGEAPLDVEAEVARLLAPVQRSGHDPGLIDRGPPARRRAQRTTRAPGPRAARRRGRGQAHARRARSISEAGGDLHIRRS